VAVTPWDSRLAHLVVLLLRNTRIRPNHVTTAGLVAGLAAAALYADGRPRALSWGAGLYVVSAVLDHADGELARLTGATTSFGHVYDRIADLVVKLALFAGMGLGLSAGPLGGWAVVMGGTAGVALVAIFSLRTELARLQGPDAFTQPSFAGFELEDILYAVPLLTWVGGLAPFLVAAGVGAPLFAAWVARQYRIARSPGFPTGASAAP